MKNLRRKLHKLLRENQDSQKAHVKKFGKCFSSCVDMQRMYEREETLKEILIQAGGRINEN